MQKRPTRSRFRPKIFFFQIAKLGRQVVRDMIIEISYALPFASVAEVFEINLIFFRSLQQAPKTLRIGWQESGDPNQKID